MDKEVYIAFLKYNGEDDELSSSRSIDLVKKLAKEKYQVQNTDIVISEKGKPYFKYSKAVKFNISHADKMSVIGFAMEEIGIDIERVMPISSKIIDKYYSINEKEEIEKCTENSLYNKILKEKEIWTRKEAHCKCTGEGITKENLLWDSSLSEGFTIRSTFRGDYVISVCLYNTIATLYRKLCFMGM